MAAYEAYAVCGDGSDVRLETSDDQNGVVQPLLTGNDFMYPVT